MFNKFGKNSAALRRLFVFIAEARYRIVEAHTVLQVREARCCMVEDRFRIQEAHGVLAFLPS